MPAERYHVGHNLAGSPRDPGAACFERWRDAAGSLMIMMREYADKDDDAVLETATPETTGYASEREWTESDAYPSMRATVDSILHDDPPIEGQDFEAIIQDNQLQAISFWLMRVACGHLPEPEVIHRQT